MDGGEKGKELTMNTYDGGRGGGIREEEEEEGKIKRGVWRFWLLLVCSCLLFYIDIYTKYKYSPYEAKLFFLVRFSRGKRNYVHEWNIGKLWVHIQNPLFLRGFFRFTYACMRRNYWSTPLAPIEPFSLLFGIGLGDKLTLGKVSPQSAGGIYGSSLRAGFNLGPTLLRATFVQFQV